MEKLILYNNLFKKRDNLSFNLLLLITYIKNLTSNFFKNFSVEEKRTGTQGREIFFHKTEITKSKFTPKIKEGDKCLFQLSKSTVLLF